MRRKILFALARIALLGVSLLLVLGLFEVGLRLAGFVAIYDVYSKPSAFWEHDPELGWSHAPGSTGTYVGPRPWPVEFETDIEINADRLRGPEIPSPSPDEKRLLFLGDSMVAAFEVEYEDTFVEQIARRAQMETGAPVRAINGGVRGYGTDQSLLFFRERGQRFEPDVVVLFHSRNDVRNNRVIHKMRRPMGKPAFVSTPSGPKLVASPAPEYPICSEIIVTDEGEVERIDTLFGRVSCRLQLTLFDHSALFSFLTLRVPWDRGFMKQLYYLGFAQKPVEKAHRISSRPSAVLTRDLIALLRDEVEAAGARFIVVSEDEILTELGLPELRAHDVEVIGLGPGEDKSQTRFANDSHYTTAGHQRVTEILSPAVVSALREQGAHEGADETIGP